MLEADVVAGTFSDSASVRTLVDHIRDCDVIVLVGSGEVIRRPWRVQDLHDAIGAGVHLVALRVTADSAQEATTLNPLRNRGICRLLPFIWQSQEHATAARRLEHTTGRAAGAMTEPAPAPPLAVDSTVTHATSARTTRAARAPSTTTTTSTPSHDSTNKLSECSVQQVHQEEASPTCVAFLRALPTHTKSGVDQAETEMLGALSRQRGGANMIWPACQPQQPSPKPAV
jgi:hypothetical protein